MITVPQRKRQRSLLCTVALYYI